MAKKLLLERLCKMNIGDVLIASGLLVGMPGNARE
jgi:hypothetical protein